jgi:long-chain acyl-CoA synthetase
LDKRVWHAHYDDGIPTTFDFAARTLPEALDRAARDRGDNTALWFLNRAMTYRELKHAVDRFATALAALGVRQGTRVAIQLPNLPQTVIAYYAVMRLGAVVVMTSPLYTEREIEHQWRDAGCEVAILADFIWMHRVRAIRGRLPVKHYVVASIPEYLHFPLNLLAPLKLRKTKPPTIAAVPREAGVHRFRELLERTPAAPPAVTVGLDDIAVLQYTGGTTGLAKGAILTQRNLSWNAQGVAAWLHIADFAEENVLGALPYFHVFGMTACMNFPVMCACTMVLVPNPRDFTALLETVAKRRVTLFIGVPALFNGINNHPHAKVKDLSCVKSCFSGSAPLPVDVLEKFEKLTGSRIVEGFGLTETSPVTHVNPLRTLRKVGSIGIPFIETDAKIVDLDTGTRDLATGEDGELVVRGPQVMQGYWNKPDETAQMIRGGWLHTGDIAHVDADGYFFISGRKKEMIIVSGYNVYPDEVDAVLVAHPAVLECGTIGLPDATCGESVKSFVVLKPGASATAEELIAHCRASLAKFKLPRAIEFRTELPRSAALKVLRRVLRDQELAKVGGPNAGGGNL